MLGEQLRLIKLSRQTHLVHKKSRITFIESDDVTIETLYQFLPFESQYTRPKSIYFDRHRLSLAEESRFNSKFRKYLLSLIKNMNYEGIEYLLEYLVRVYSIDSFNTEELLFLLFPFKKYEDLIVKLTKYHTSCFGKITGYSVHSLSKLFTTNCVTMNYYVKYFEFYPIFKDFLNRSLSFIVKILKSGKSNYIAEFMVIFNYLEKHGEIDLILQTYKSMSKYLNSDEFNEYFKRFTNKI
ncbi:hypothetical protein HERIO_976 [Hepatospora eriocheir]|uniref:Uncharacterized protein n=1 Tax=Hepatospora eriocheir TaxID=1081669 RepID=A0A1X0QBJ0_9MICR|nr:hypothetical protein HERIO_976 [Hepatospora eriocheir]